LRPALKGSHLAALWIRRLASRAGKLDLAIEALKRPAHWSENEQVKAALSRYLENRRAKSRNRGAGRPRNGISAKRAQGGYERSRVLASAVMLAHQIVLVRVFALAQGLTWVPGGGGSACRVSGGGVFRGAVGEGSGRARVGGDGSKHGFVCSVSRGSYLLFHSLVSTRRR